MKVLVLRGALKGYIFDVKYTYKNHGYKLYVCDTSTIGHEEIDFPADIVKEI